MLTATSDCAPSALSILHSTYLPHLIAARANQPEKYRWEAADAPLIAAKLFDQIAASGIHSVSIDGPAWKATL